MCHDTSDRYETHTSVHAQPEKHLCSGLWLRPVGCMNTSAGVSLISFYIASSLSCSLLFLRVLVRESREKEKKREEFTMPLVAYIYRYSLTDATDCFLQRTRYLVDMYVRMILINKSILVPGMIQIDTFVSLYLGLALSCCLLFCCCCWWWWWWWWCAQVRREDRRRAP